MHLIKTKKHFRIPVEAPLSISLANTDNKALLLLCWQKKPKKVSHLEQDEMQ